MNGLEALYNNASSYAEDFGYNTSREWRILTQEIADLKEELSSILDNPQREKFNQLHSLYIDQMGLEIDRMFYFAFKRGANLIIDIRNE